jgi:hypothetical protein
MLPALADWGGRPLNLKLYLMETSKAFLYDRQGTDLEIMGVHTDCGNSI